MHLVYANEYPDGVKSNDPSWTYAQPSIFLCGPTPRSSDVSSWRPNFIRELESCHFAINVFIPEDRDGQFRSEYDKQIEWEHEHLDKASLVVFWVPRDLETMPAFTTNCEFGMLLKSGKILYGRPDGAPKTSYLDYCYKKFTGYSPSWSVAELITKAGIFLERKFGRSLYEQDYLQEAEAISYRMARGE